MSHRHLSDIESILNGINGLPQGGENQVILAQKLIPFLFRIEKKLSKNRQLNNQKKLAIHNSQFQAKVFLRKTLAWKAKVSATETFAWNTIHNSFTSQFSLTTPGLPGYFSAPLDILA